MIGLAAVLILAGCAVSTTHRGEVEFGRMRVTTTVEEVPRLATVPDISYPEVLLAQGIEGTAEVSFVVDDFGVPRDLAIVSASAPGFGDATMRGVRRLRYVPATRDGKRVRCGVHVTVFFKIH